MSFLDIASKLYANCNIDLAIAIDYMTLAATDLGLG